MVKQFNQYVFRYSICVEERWPTEHTYFDPIQRVFVPRNDEGEAAYKECLDVWNSLIVPNITVERGSRYSYSIDADWGSGNCEKTEYRYSDELIRFDHMVEALSSLPGALTI
jgi:hypothetical protein